MLLRSFIGEDDRHAHLPLYEAMVLKAREPRLAGATVLRGPLGFGHSSRLHTAKMRRLSDLPMVIEIVDSQQKNRRLRAAVGGHDRRRPGHAREGPGRALRAGKAGLSPHPRSWTWTSTASPSGATRPTR